MATRGQSNYNTVDRLMLLHNACFCGGEVSHMTIFSGIFSLRSLSNLLFWWPQRIGQQCGEKEQQKRRKLTGIWRWQVWRTRKISCTSIDFRQKGKCIKQNWNVMFDCQPKNKGSVGALPELTVFWVMFLLLLRNREIWTSREKNPVPSVWTSYTQRGILGCLPQGC